jgi:hypothetical protein
MKLFHSINHTELNLTIRLFKNSDTEGVIECICSEYGDTYFKKQFYDPDYLIKVHSENTVTFVVAETDEHEIAGIIALKSFFPGEIMCELASEILKKEFRGYGLSEHMIRFGANVIEERCYSAIYSLPVTFHSITQRLLQRIGLTVTGFIFSVFITDKVESSYEYGQCMKHSQGIQIKAMEKQNAGNIYIPKELQPIAQRIYNKLGVAFQIFLPDAEQIICEEKKTMLYYTNDDIHKNCAITLMKIGSDINVQILNICSKYRDIPLQTFNIFLNINDPNAVYAYEILKNSGFFFTGFKSLCSNNEYMVMHNNNGIEMYLDDYDLIEEYKDLMQLIKPFIGEVLK